MIIQLLESNVWTFKHIIIVWYWYNFWLGKNIAIENDMKLKKCNRMHMETV